MNTPRFFFRQCLRVILWGGGVLAVLYALTAWILNWTGDRRWERVKAELVVAGGSLDYLELLPPPIPAEQNFAAIEPLNGIRTPPGESEAALAAQAKRDAIEKATEFVTRSKVKAGVSLRSECFTAARGVNMEELVRVYHDGGFLEWPEDSPADARGLQIAIEKHAPFILELGQAAEARPGAGILPKLTKETVPDNLLAMNLSYFSGMSNLASTAKIHGLACVHAGDADGAWKDIHIILRLSKASCAESSWIGYLLGMTVFRQACDILWEQLQRARFDERDLSEMQEQFARMDHSPLLLQSSHGEIAMMVSGVDWASQNLDAVDSLLILESGASVKRLARILPRGFYTHSLSTLVTAEIEWIITPQKVGGIGELFRQREAFKNFNIQNAETYWRRPDYMLARLVLPTFALIVIKSAHAENTRRQAVLACALERHRLRHQAYPATLADLQIKVPAPCLEGVDGKPMRYRLSEDGRYRLWSDGLDGKDDGGAFHVELHPGEKSPQPDNERYQGDWVWRYDAVK